MLTFRSEVFPDFFPEKISYNSKSIFIGSCFTEHIGKKMDNLKFPVLINPFGVIYNPASVSKSLEIMLNPYIFEEKHLMLFNEKWISLLHHGRFSDINSGEVLKVINSEIALAGEYLKQSAVIFITFGTAWVYKHKKTNQVVANCHKIPSSEFEHYLLTVSDIVETYGSLLTDLKNKFAHLKVVFTVSPVRHWKDGATNNQISKSILFVALHELMTQFDFVSYFPSYEIIMDDLRDYRFYADDLFHPNQLGIEYVWEKFKTCYLDTQALNLAEKVDKILKAIAHKPFYPKTKAYLNFLDGNILAIKQLISKYPGLNLKDEIQYFMNEKEQNFNNMPKL